MRCAIWVPGTQANSSPQEEQHVFVTAEPSLQHPHIIVFFKEVSFYFHVSQIKLTLVGFVTDTKVPCPHLTHLILSWPQSWLG